MWCLGRVCRPRCCFVSDKQFNLVVDCLVKKRRIKRRGVKHTKGLINNSRHLTWGTWSNYDRKESWLIT